MIRLNQKMHKKLFKAIENELFLEIIDHGPIDKKLVFSATKRIVGQIKTFIYNGQVKEQKRIRGFGLIQAGVTIFDKDGSVLIMAIAKNYAMMRRPRCMPFVEYYADIPKKYYWGKPSCPT